MNRKQFLKLSCGAVASSALTSALPASVNIAQTRVSFDFRTLGRSGIKVRPLGMGGARTNEPALLARALEAGINFVDTGRGYFNGQNEVMIGDLIKGRRAEVVVQSKCRVDPGSRAIGAAMEKSLAESLKALKSDYLDVLLIHGADSVETIRHPAVMEFFAAAKQRGQIRASGFSVHVNQMELLKAAASDGFYDVIMLPYNHQGKFVHSNSGRRGEWDQPALEAALRAAIAKGLGVVAMKTCSGGAYAWPDELKPSFASAVRWILTRDCIHTSAVAMASFEQLEEDLKAIS